MKQIRPNLTTDLWPSSVLHLDRALLEANDIPVELRDENTAQMEWGIKHATGGVKLAVPEKEVEAALDLIGRLTVEGQKRTDEMDRQIKRSVGMFALKVAAVGLVIFALKGFPSGMVGPCLVISFMLNAVVAFLMSRFKTDKPPK